MEVELRRVTAPPGDARDIPSRSDPSRPGNFPMRAKRAGYRQTLTTLAEVPIIFVRLFTPIQWRVTAAHHLGALGLMAMASEQRAEWHPEHPQTDSRVGI